MGEVQLIYPRRPTNSPSVPRAPSRRNAPVRQRAKHLFPEDPSCGILRNSLGERFDIQTQFPNNGQFLEVALRSRERPSGNITIRICLLAFKDENKVKISGIATESEAFPGKHKFEKPSPEDRGYGIMRLVMQFAKRFAKEHSITSIAITPANKHLRKYYIETWGFQCSEVNECGVETELSLRLKK